MHSVEWSGPALNQLAAIWQSAPDRDAVRVAVAEIDRRLARDARTEGESREGDFRVTFCGPLALRFEVDAQGSSVRIVNVWTIPRRSRG
jgi:hypothetical protein